MSAELRNSGTRSARRSLVQGIVPRVLMTVVNVRVVGMTVGHWLVPVPVRVGLHPIPRKAMHVLMMHVM